MLKFTTNSGTWWRNKHKNILLLPCSAVVLKLHIFITSCSPICSVISLGGRGYAWTWAKKSILASVIPILPNYCCVVDLLHDSFYSENSSQRHIKKVLTFVCQPIVDIQWCVVNPELYKIWIIDWVGDRSACLCCYDVYAASVSTVLSLYIFVFWNCVPQFMLSELLGICQ